MHFYTGHEAVAAGVCEALEPPDWIASTYRGHGHCIAREPTVHEQPPEFTLGKAIVLRPGNDLTLISTGGMLETAARTAEELAEDGIETRVVSMHTLKPLDTDAVRAAVLETGAVATLEEHSIVGGLGSAVAEFLAEHERRVPFKRLGLPSRFSPHVGSQEYLLAQHQLAVDDVIRELRLFAVQASPT